MDKTNGSDHGAATATTDISLSCKAQSQTLSLSSLSFSLWRERGTQFFSENGQWAASYHNMTVTTLWHLCNSALSLSLTLWQAISIVFFSAQVYRNL